MGNIENCLVTPEPHPKKTFLKENHRNLEPYKFRAGDEPKKCTDLHILDM